jgi:hypothetical protein
MKNYFTLVLLLVMGLTTACSSLQKFDKVETTMVDRYKIVYKENKYGLYDIKADSLVTAIKYDALKYGRTATEQGLEFTVWVGEIMDYEGMIAIESRTNKSM